MSDQNMHRQDSGTNASTKSEEFVFSYSGTSQHGPQTVQASASHNATTTEGVASASTIPAPTTGTVVAPVKPRKNGRSGGHASSGGGAKTSNNASANPNQQQSSDDDEGSILPKNIAPSGRRESNSGLLNMDAFHHTNNNNTTNTTHTNDTVTNNNTSNTPANLLSPPTQPGQHRRIRSASGIRRGNQTTGFRPENSTSATPNHQEQGQQQQQQQPTSPENNNNNSSIENKTNNSIASLSNQDPSNSGLLLSNDSNNPGERDLPWSFSAINENSKFQYFESVGVSSEKGNRKTMEDQHCALIGNADNSNNNNDDDDRPTGAQSGGYFGGIPFFAVYDGHAGTQCSNWLSENLHHLIMSQPNVRTNPEAAITAGVLKAEEQFLKKSEEEKMEAGSTVALAMIVNGNLVVGNVGDSEIILSRGGKAVVLTTKHHMKDNADEEKRVRAAGGRVHNYRVGHPKFNPALMSIAVSRAVGDAGFKLDEYTDGRPSGLIADPSTKTTPLTPEDEFFVIGCDGLWDVMTYQDCVDICRQKLAQGTSSQEMTDLLVNEALDRHSGDNITVLFVSLRARGATPLSRSTSANVAPTSGRQGGGGPSAAAQAGNSPNNNNSSQQQHQQQAAAVGDATTPPQQQQGGLSKEISSSGSNHSERLNEDQKSASTKFTVDDWDYDGS